MTMGVLSIVCVLTTTTGPLCKPAHEWFRQQVSSGPHSAVRGWEMPDVPGRGIVQSGTQMDFSRSWNVATGWDSLYPRGS